MRAWAVVFAACVACEGGFVTIGDDPALVDDTDGTPDVSGDTETDLPDDGSDTEPDPADDDTDPVVDTDPSDGDVLDASRLAWDGAMKWTFTQWWGGTCTYTLVETGEELAAGDPDRARVAALCPDCDRLFRVRIAHRGQDCLEAYPTTEWRALEVRPTGTLVVRLIREVPGGALEVRETLGNVPFLTDRFTLRYDTFAPVYAKTVIAGTVVLSPSP